MRIANLETSAEPRPVSWHATASSHLQDERSMRGVSRVKGSVLKIRAFQRSRLGGAINAAELVEALAGFRESISFNRVLSD